uniref:C-type lectin domain-containing protein n=1 Tax=Hucho hucho TaxID=62062 RepID=A0A4W5RED9_9TELE
MRSIAYQEGIMFGLPNNKLGNQDCVSLWKNEMNDYQCTEQYPILCFDLNVVLVKENKTWEEALEHCRENYTDLTSLLSENDQLLVQRMMNSKGAQTDHVWTGLRFLASTWLWVNGDPVEYQAWTEGRLPHCPTQHLRLTPSGARHLHLVITEVKTYARSIFTTINHLNLNII